MRNRIPNGALIFAVVAAFLMAGCSSLGKDNILFVTKTSVGVDFDVKPPTLVIGFDRKEGTIAPEFDSGEVLPQMAGFTSDLGIINQAIGQSFATGNAAVLMAQYLASLARPKLGNPIDVEGDYGEPASAKTTGQRKRYFFGTDTSFAFKVGFGLETGGLPDSLSLGYKRKELAFVPLFEIDDPNSDDTDAKVVYLPSLLATAGLATVADPKKQNQTKVVHSQFFATGLAATYLAALPEIRAAVAPKIMPEARKLSKANEANIAKGVVMAETRQSDIERIVGHVTLAGSWTGTSNAELTKLFDSASIDASNPNRAFVEPATSADELKELLGQITPAFVARLAAAVS